MNNQRERKRKNPDLRTAQEKAEWEEIRAGSIEMQRRARPPEAPKPFDLRLKNVVSINDRPSSLTSPAQTSSARSTAFPSISGSVDEPRLGAILLAESSARFAF